MKVFNYLLEDSAHILEQSEETIENFSEWTMDRIFEMTKKILTAIKHHFEKEIILVQNIKSSDGSKNILDQAERERKTILSKIDRIVMVHVDEPGFKQLLESIVRDFQAHRSFCQDKLYSVVKRLLSKTDLDHINEQLGQIIFS